MATKKIFADIHPDLLEEWNWGKNAEIADPYTIGCNSTKMTWWKCKKCGYEWQTAIYNRHIGRGCPYCAKNVVWSGHNDLATLYPELIKEWDYQKNINNDPTTLAITSKNMAWWICHVCGYEWNAEVGSRASGGNGCPYCSGKAVWEGHNDLKTKNPFLAKEWNYKKNEKLLPSMVTAGSRKKVWWCCNVCGYEWLATINSRSRGAGCPECNKSRIGNNHRITSLKEGKNSLSALNPQLASEWNYEKNTLTPSDVTANTMRKVWWTCPDCGYVYFSSIANRHRNGTGCPVCANQVLCEGINDLQTLYPDIAIEWYEKNALPPNKVLAGGKTKYFFKCSHCGYIWKTSIRLRIYGTGCPKCTSSLHTSIPEQVIYQCLKTTIPSAKNSYKPKWLNGREIDIFLPEQKVGIEYDGRGWHKDIVRDIKKTKILKEHGIPLIRIREPGCPEIDDDSIQILTSEPKSDLSHLKEAIENLMTLLREAYNVEVEASYNINEIYTKELTRYRNKHLEISFASEHPDLLQEWDVIKNKGLDPYKIPPRSSINVWWKCNTCSYEWKATIDRRASGAGCPYCTHEVVWAGHNDVETLRPDLLTEWDYENNDVLPKEVTPNSHRKIAWKCSKCGHMWKSPLYNKSTGHGCPKCARAEVARKQSKQVKNLDTGEVYDSVSLASIATGIGATNITRVCRGEGKSAGGYHWAYVK